MIKLACFIKNSDWDKRLAMFVVKTLSVFTKIILHLSYTKQNERLTWLVSLSVDLFRSKLNKHVNFFLLLFSFFFFYSIFSQRIVTKWHNNNFLCVCCCCCLGSLADDSAYNLKGKRIPLTTNMISHHKVRTSFFLFFFLFFVCKHLYTFYLQEKSIASNQDSIRCSVHMFDLW